MQGTYDIYLGPEEWIECFFEIADPRAWNNKCIAGLCGWVIPPKTLNGFSGGWFGQPISGRESTTIQLPY